MLMGQEKICWCLRLGILGKLFKENLLCSVLKFLQKCSCINCDNTYLDFFRSITYAIFVA